MNIELNNAIIAMDRLVTIGITETSHEEKVKTGETYFFGLFDKFKIETNTTYNIEIKYYLDKQYRTFLHTGYDSMSSANNALISIKKQIKDYDNSFIDRAFEDTVIKGK